MKKNFLLAFLIPWISQSFAQSGGTLTILGTTTYDNLPSNQRLFPGPNGTMSATWTGSNWLGTPASAIGWPDRGTFYAYFNGTQWDTTNDGRRIEDTTRTGFPSNVLLSNGSEWVCSHLPYDTTLGFSTRTTAGNGAWNFSGPSSTLKVMWPHATAFGNTIHVVGVVDHDSSTGYLKYFRSSDGGQTWDNVADRLPLEDSTDCVLFNEPDEYAIDARGNTIAIVAGGVYNSVFLWKSLDNGNTWTRSEIADYSICQGLFSKNITNPNDNGIPAAVEATDGDFSLIIDKNDKVHVWFGDLVVIKDSATSNSAGIEIYYPRSYYGLRYWNDSYPVDSFQLVAHYSLTDSAGLGKGTTSYTGIGIVGGGLFSSTLASMPTAAIDTTSGTIYCVFSEAVPNSDLYGSSDPSTDATVLSLRDLYGIYSKDGGNTWTSPMDLTNTAAITATNNSLQWENVYPAAARYADKNGGVDVMWMRDGTPGTYVLNGATVNPLDVNQIVFESFSLANFDAVKNIPGTNRENLGVYPNPSNGIINLDLVGMDNEKATITITNTIGETLKTYDSVVLSGNVQVSASDLADGLYLVKVQTTTHILTGKVTIAH